jgi:hypothetical protein
MTTGCAPATIDTTYGRSRGESINGTGVLAELFRASGHEVRTAVRLTKTLGEWASVIVRFAPTPGPPEKAEGDWLLRWLNETPGRKVIYVPHDFSAEPEFWTAMLAAEPEGTPASVIERIKDYAQTSKGWHTSLPNRPKQVASAEDWFAVEAKPRNPSLCARLEGNWAEDIDPKAAALTKHETLKILHNEEALLQGDGEPLVLTWSYYNGNEAMAIASATFLLNASLLNPARRPLAAKVVEWVGDEPRHVAFLEGSYVLAENKSSSFSFLELARVEPFGWVGIHFLGFGLLYCLARAARLGRPRPEPPSGVERPAAHPEALGTLMARTGQSDVARSLLDAYRRWRQPTPGTSRPGSPSHPPSRNPLA